MRWWISTLTLVLLITNTTIAAESSSKYWLTTSLQRVFPSSKPGEGRIELLAVRNGRVSFQACVRNESTKPLDVECKVIGADDLKPMVRWVGLVPMHHLTPHTDAKELDGVGNIPGLVPDPLMPTSKGTIGPFESRSFWITLNVPADAEPGQREPTVNLGV